jgi:hypothetical protein
VGLRKIIFSFGMPFASGPGGPLRRGTAKMAV